ncbi:MAG: hypothetical protein V3W41_20535 [Planctomycetota bacterium]
MDQNDLGRLMDSMRSEPAKKPGGFFSESGDCVFFYNEDVPYVRDRIDGLVTVYRAIDDSRIIGVQVKNVSRLPFHDALQVEVSSVNQRDMVRLLLLTFAKTEPTEDSTTKYTDAIRKMNEPALAG